MPSFIIVCSTWSAALEAPNLAAPGAMQELEEFTSALIAACHASYQRRVVVIAGERDWCLRQTGTLLARSRPTAIAWLGSRSFAEIAPRQAICGRPTLGGEVDALVIDAWDGFDPDACAASFGAVRGGGLVILLAPPLAKWPAYADPATDRIAAYPHTRGQLTGRYLRRLVRIIRSSKDALLLEPHTPLPELTSPLVSPFDASTKGAHELPTTDQLRAIAAIERCARGHRRRPVVITSDRGRGKSAALGIAAARLLGGGIKRIIVTAPSLASAAMLFRHARILLPQAAGRHGHISTDDRILEFMAPDALLSRAQPTDLLLVDEAAAIPTPLLGRLLERYARIVFASTVHGYEGSGRGFALSFRRILDQKTPGWQGHWLETPIRWARDDPAERFVFQALLLNAHPAAPGALASATAGRCRIEPLERDRLVSDECTLNELFGLLVLAHYRTTPGDLRHLLDAPEVSVWVLRHHGHVAAAALLVDEGGFPAELAEAIWLGKRRPRGHLVAQSLATHAGLAQAPRLAGRRVLRIAVHPACQRRGLGTRLLCRVFTKARDDGIDYVSAAFGATEELVHFWARLGLRLVRVGNHREASSGNHSAIMLRPLSQAGEGLADSARARFAERFSNLLSEPLRDLEPALALRLFYQLGACDTPAPAIDDWDDLLAFGFGRRQYADSLVALQRLSRYALTNPRLRALLSHSEQCLLLARTLQQHDWEMLADYCNAPGRRHVESLLRASVRRLALSSSNREVRHRARALQQLP